MSSGEEELHPEGLGAKEEDKLTASDDAAGEDTSGDSDDGEVGRHEAEGPVEKLPVYIPGADCVDITKDKDGGVTKEIRRHGSGDEHPMAQDTVFVHYVGTLTDGTKFDSSRDSGKMFEFTLGKGSVIKAWDLAVATMKRGELCVIQCAAKYAYGKKGSKPKIPPNATLVFEIELFDWKGEDITKEKDGGIVKSCLVEGEGYQTPRDMATCEVHVIGKQNGRIFEDRDLTFVIGEADEVGVVAAVEEIARNSKKGERSRSKVKAAYAYGSKGKAEFEIPADADLEYEVEMKSFEQLKDSWQLQIVEKLQVSEDLKNKGTNFFKAGKYEHAKKYYEKIVDYLKDEDKLINDGDAEMRKRLLVAAHLNVAMCHLKMKNDLEATRSCDEALKIEPSNEKGLFRRGTANFNLRNYVEALVDFKAVLDNDPENKAARNQMTIVSHKIKQIRDKEKKTYAGMFDRFAEADAKKAETLKVWKDGEEDQPPKKDNPEGDNLSKDKESTAEAEEEVEKDKDAAAAGFGDQLTASA